jgi:hypothetical protein
VAEDFVDAAASEPGGPFFSLKVRGRGEDPPDCELTSSDGRRLAVEITELVDRKTVEAVNEYIKRNPTAPRPGGWVEWDSAKLIAALEERLAAKHFRHKLKGGPFDEYIVLVYTAEPALDGDSTRRLIADHQFTPYPAIDRAYLLLDYMPDINFPLIRLPLGGRA